MRFTKWQGCGNDFVLVDCRKENVADFAATAKTFCDRHYGIGADGVLYVLPGENADFTMRIFNADGTEAQMCGNGIRCFAKYLYDFGFADGKEFSVATKAGVMRPKIITGENGAELVEVDMGEPILEGEKIPVKAQGKVIEYPLEVDGKNFNVTCVSMGNPHCVVFCDDIKTCGIEHLGTLFEHHEFFPERVNTEFAQIIDKTHVRMRVWERGAAITLACGTGSCATLAAGALTGRTEKKAVIILDGGQLTVEWKDNNRLYMTGDAELVFEGEVRSNL